MKKRTLIFIGMTTFLLSTFAYIQYHQMNINDIALTMFGWVKKIKGEQVKIKQIENGNHPPIAHDSWNELLIKHVQISGKVNYASFIEDKTKLTNYLKELSKNPPNATWSKQAQLAYWINAYNAFTIQLIIEHYPLKSIKNISNGLPMINSPWDIKFFKIADIPFDLNTIEHEILRKRFQEPRIHFAINCASISCPILRNEAYTAAQLEEQLAQQAKVFINDPQKNRITNEAVKLSKIFDWFASDFLKTGTTINSYIQQYSNQKVPLNLKPTYLEYDWNLNE